MCVIYLCTCSINTLSSLAVNELYRKLPWHWQKLLHCRNILILLRKCWTYTCTSSIPPPPNMYTHIHLLILFKAGKSPFVCVPQFGHYFDWLCSALCMYGLFAYGVIWMRAVTIRKPSVQLNFSTNCSLENGTHGWRKKKSEEEKNHHTILAHSDVEDT